MKTLSGLDATFLSETPETPMHVGSLHLYELPRGLHGHAFTRRSGPGIANRMQLAPMFGRRLAFMPLDLGHRPGSRPTRWTWTITSARPVVAGSRCSRCRGGRTAAWRADRPQTGRCGSSTSSKMWPRPTAWPCRASWWRSIPGAPAALDGKGGTVLANAIPRPQRHRAVPPRPGTSAAPRAT